MYFWFFDQKVWINCTIVSIFLFFNINYDVFFGQWVIIWKQKIQGCKRPCGGGQRACSGKGSPTWEGESWSQGRARSGQEKARGGACSGLTSHF